MANKFAHIRSKAEELRRRGYSLIDISEMLAMSKTTVHYWIRHIPRGAKRWSKEYRTAHWHNIKSSHIKAGEAVSKIWEKRRKIEYDRAKDAYPELIKQPHFANFIMLYLTEGYRRCRNQVSVSNSNSTLMKLAYYWMTKLTSKPPEKFVFGIQLHVDQDEQELRVYWSKQLSIASTRIKVIRKSNSNKLSGRLWRSKYGVLAVTLNDTFLRSRIQCWMDLVEEEMNRSMG